MYARYTLAQNQMSSWLRQGRRTTCAHVPCMDEGPAVAFFLSTKGGGQTGESTLVLRWAAKGLA